MTEEKAEQKQNEGEAATPAEVRDDKTGKISKFIKRLRIVVTLHDIESAIRAKSNKCMIHQAIKRDHPEFRAILVELKHVRFTDPRTNSIYTFPMSPIGRAMLYKWDQGENIAPFDIWLSEPVVRARVIRRGRKVPAAGRDRATRSTGAIPRARTKEAAARIGRDRIFGQKLWTKELQKLRSALEIKAPAPAVA
jgi:hypothetical protein